jgi:hypothetical protein
MKALHKGVRAIMELGCGSSWDNWWGGASADPARKQHKWVKSFLYHYLERQITLLDWNARYLVSCCFGEAILNQQAQFFSCNDQICQLWWGATEGKAERGLLMGKYDPTNRGTKAGCIRDLHHTCTYFRIHNKGTITISQEIILKWGGGGGGNR